MQKFLRKTVLFILPLILCAILIEVGLRQIPNDYKFKSEIIQNDSIKFETIILGHSQARDGVNPAFLSSKAFNFSNSAQSLYYDLAIFKKIINKKREIRNVIIPISYFTMNYTLENGPQSYLNKNYSLYMDIKSKNLKYESEILSGLNLKIQLYRLLRFIIKNEYPLISNNGYYYSDAVVGSNEVREDAERTVKRQLNYIVTNGNEIVEKNKAIINEFISITKRNNINIIFFTPPLTKTLTNLIPDSLHMNIETYFKEIDQTFTHIQYFSFINCANFETTDFKDSSHLNSRGAEKLSNLLNIYVEKQLSTSKTSLQKL